MITLYEAQLRHAQHYASVLRTAADLATQSQDRNTPVQNVFNTEQQNALSALSWTADHAGEDDTAAVLCNQLLAYSDPVFLVSRNFNERLRWLNVGLVAARRQRWPHLESHYLNMVSIVFFALGKYEEANKLMREALAIDYESSDQHSEAMLLCHFSDPYVGFGDLFAELNRSGSFYDPVKLMADETQNPEESVAIDEQILKQHQETGDLLGQAVALTNLAASCERLDQTQRALKLYWQAFATYRQLTGADKTVLELCRLREANLLFSIGNLHLKTKNVSEAINVLQQSLALYEVLGAKREQVFALERLANACKAAGETPRANALFKEAWQLAHMLDLAIEPYLKVLVNDRLLPGYS